jgi:hypothetical protein
MSCSASDVRVLGRTGAAVALLLTLVWPAFAEAQDRGRTIVSSEISLSRDEASLRLGYGGDREDRWFLRDGKFFANDQLIGEAARGSALDDAWRELLNEAMELETADLAHLLVDWDAPETGDVANDRVGITLDQMLEARLTGIVAANAGASQDVDADAIGEAVEAELSDSMSRLVERISELQEQVERFEVEERVIAPHVNVDVPARRGGFGGPFRHFFRGLSGVFSNLVLYAVLFGIAFATIFFGGRKYIEGVADTMRAAPTRSLLVGLAAAFLVVPAFILGVIALLISIVGIPALLLWVPLFPVAVGAAVLLGYIGAAHAGGEALAERRFYTSDWFQRGNSYYFIMTGLGMLLSLFLAANVIQMAGPWLGFLRSMLVGLGVVLTASVISMGFGAVLLSRAGTRPMRPKRSASPEPDIYAEATNV